MQSYYPGGMLERVIHYVNNMKHGEEVWFSETGDTLRVLRYHEGRLQP